MNFSGNKSTPSKIIPSIVGGKPLIERTDGEKIRICKTYLEKHNYVVVGSLMTRAEVCAFLQVSGQHINNLLASASFPKPIDVGSKRKCIDSNHRMLRWRTSDITAWVESGVCQ